MMPADTSPTRTRRKRIDLQDPDTVDLVEGERRGNEPLAKTARRLLQEAVARRAGQTVVARELAGVPKAAEAGPEEF